jgi:hypothetical protein
VLASQTRGPRERDRRLARSHDKTYTELADVLGDRRPELYGAVAQPTARPVA